MATVKMQTFNLQQGPVITSYSGYVTPLSDGTVTVDARDVGTMQVLGFTVIGANAESPTYTNLTISSLTSGSVLFAGAGGVVSQDNANFFWDATNHGLKIGSSVLGSYSLAIGNGSASVNIDHSHVDFFAKDSNNNLLKSVSIEGGYASNTAGSQKGDMDFIFDINGATSIVAFDGTLPAFTPATGDVWDLGATGQAWRGSYISTIYNENGLITARLSDANVFQYGANRIKGAATAVSLYDGAAQELANFQSLGTAINYVQFLARATGIAPSIQTISGDTNCDLTLLGQGTGKVNVIGPFAASGTGDFTAPVRLSHGYTVATLPGGTVGQCAYVTDALAPTFLAAVVGGGAITAPVFYNGSAWVGG